MRRLRLGAGVQARPGHVWEGGLPGAAPAALQARGARAAEQLAQVHPA